MSPFKSTKSFSVGKLLQTFRGRDADGADVLNSNIRTKRFPVPKYTVTNADSTNTAGGYKYITWITSGSFSLINGPDSVYYLLVGGGGEGAQQNSAGDPGDNSTALGLTAYGGGTGGYYPGGAGATGGSGGGGGGGTTQRPYGLNPNTPEPVINASFPNESFPYPLTQGNNGGICTPSSNLYGGAGGGGAGAAGADAPTAGTKQPGAIGAAAMGGDPNFPSDYGTAGPSPGRWFAAGGGGAGGTPHGAGAAQPYGGGGSGKTSTPAATGNAVANTGSGGGGYAASTGGASGGGGAGGFLSAPMTLANATYPIVIGDGGTGGNGGDGAAGIFVLRVPADSDVA